MGIFSPLVEVDSTGPSGSSASPASVGAAEESPGAPDSNGFYGTRAFGSHAPPGSSTSSSTTWFQEVSLLGVVLFPGGASEAWGRRGRAPGA